MVSYNCTEIPLDAPYLSSDSYLRQNLLFTILGYSSSFQYSRIIYNTNQHPRQFFLGETMPDDDMDLASGIMAFEAKHFSRALQILSQLAEKGDTDAQYRCAIMYQNGLGLVANPDAALRWMKAAAEQGHALAQHGLGFMYMEGDCTEQNGEEAIKWFTKAAEQGLQGSQTTLAMMYEEGHGVERDPEKAKQWYGRAGFSSEET